MDSLAFKFSIIVAFVFVLSFSPSMAMDGVELLDDCERRFLGTEKMDYFHAGSCFGEIEGVVGALLYFKLKLPQYAQICLPEQFTIAQGRLILIKYLNNHPEQLHRADAALIHAAMNEAFPCK